MVRRIKFFEKIRNEIIGIKKTADNVLFNK